MTATNLQEGGMKIIVKNEIDEDVVIRKIVDIRQFISIFSNTIHIDILSVDSLTGFILRITLPEYATPFRSDIFSDVGELMTAKEHRQPTTGKHVTQHILKCCIIQPYKEPKIGEYTVGRKKGTCTQKEFIDEYKSQSVVYDTTMAYGGMPVCPDAYACLEFNLLEFREVFFPDSLSPISPHHLRLPSIGTDVFKDNRVFQYLLEQMEAVIPPVAGQLAFERKVGIIVMESLPSSYKQLMDLYNALPPPSVPISAYITNPVLEKRKKLFDQITERALVICVIMFYRSGFIPLDAHMGNWMYDVSNRFDQFKVRAIDFGRFFFRKGEKNIKQICRIITLYVRQFGGNGASLANMLNSFAILLNVNPSKITTALEAGDQVGESFMDLNKLIKRNQNGSILWNPINAKNQYLIVIAPATATQPEKIMEIDSCIVLIHSILFLIALVDSCYNSICLRNHHFCQLRNIFAVLFGIKCNNLIDIIRHNVSINLEDYLNSIPDYSERIDTIQRYERIRDYIRDYLRVTDERGLFEDEYLEEISPDTPEDHPAVVARSLPPLSIPRSSPSSPHHLSRKSPRKSSPKEIKVTPLVGSPQAYEYERFLSGYNVSYPPQSLARGGSTKKILNSKNLKKLRQSIQSIQSIQSRKSRKPIKTKLSKFLKTKKNKNYKNYNRYRRNKRYRL